ncbi:MAG: hypothetical protein SPE24_08520 [Erysipelotrichaceae bacterium]|nr:hypothetical protein [Erysipelotrichaceae bacterium]
MKNIQQKEQLIKFLDDNGIETDNKDKREVLVYEIMNCFDEDKGLSDKGKCGRY